MSSFIVTALVTCFFAAVQLFCISSQSCSFYMYKRHRIVRPSTETVRTFLRSCRDSTGQTLHPAGFEHHALAKLEWTIYKMPRTIATPLIYVVAPILRMFCFEHPIARHMAQLSLDALCDIQVVTGTAIIIAGFAGLDQMTAYHKSFVMNYWFLALNAFWAARAGVLNRANSTLQAESVASTTVKRTYSNIENLSLSHSNTTDGVDGASSFDSWHYWTRTAAIFCSLTLSAAYQIIFIPREAREWSPVEAGKCYIAHDTSDPNFQYFWLAETIIYAFYLLCIMLVGLFWGDDMPLRRLLAQFLVLQQRMVRYLRRVRDDWARHAVLGWPLRIILYALLELVLVVGYLVFIFLDIISLGRSNSILVVLFYFGFAGWNIYNIIDIKVSNVGLVDAEEGQWGFGQVLSMSLLWLVIIGIGDSWRGMWTVLRFHSPTYMQDI